MAFDLLRANCELGRHSAGSRVVVLPRGSSGMQPQWDRQTQPLVIRDHESGLMGVERGQGSGHNGVHRSTWNQGERDKHSACPLNDPLYLGA